VHLAAAVGVAQSMYEIERFVDVNARGTAILLEAAVAAGSRVQKFVVASSMSLYGEGACLCPRCGPFHPRMRGRAQLEKKDFEVRCPRCQSAAAPAPTGEDARLLPTTPYAVTKRDQEELVLAVGEAYRLPSVALRLFNVYGPRQSPGNPYTGVSTIFATRLLAGKAPLVFEDGLQTRDFTHVTEVAEAFARAVDDPRCAGQAINVGAGRAVTLLELGALVARELGREWNPEMTGAFREGDIRHCTADARLIEATLGFRPSIDFGTGVRELVEWVRAQPPRDDAATGSDRALAELRQRGLVR
jgi:dTDP-L-rhamnose 4-epimerase